MNSKKLLLVYLITLTIPVFAQQADMSLIPYRKGGLWGYASPDKKIVITPAYGEVNLFYEGYASVKKGTNYGYINKAGKVVIPFKFLSAKSFRFGYRDNGPKKRQDTVLFAAASMTADGYEICINTKGIRMPKCPAINDNSVPENTKPLLKDTAESFFSTINKSETFDKALDQYNLGGEDNYYVVVKNDQYGVIF